MKPFRGTTTEKDIIYAIKVVKYNFTGLGTGELQVNEGDYVLPFPDQSECPAGWTLVFHVPMNENTETNNDSSNFSVGYVPSQYLTSITEYDATDDDNEKSKPPSPRQVSFTIPYYETESIPSIDTEEEKKSEDSPKANTASIPSPVDTPKIMSKEDELSTLLNVVLPSTRLAEANRNKAEHEASAYVQGYGDALDRLRIELELSRKEIDDKILVVKEEIRLNNNISLSKNDTNNNNTFTYKATTIVHNPVITKLYAKLHDLENDRLVITKQIDMLNNLEKQHKDILDTRVQYTKLNDTKDFHSLSKSSVPSHLSKPKDSTGVSSSSSVSQPTVRRRAPPLPPVMAQFQSIQSSNQRITDFTNNSIINKSLSSYTGLNSSSNIHNRWNSALTPGSSYAPLSSSSSSLLSSFNSDPYTLQQLHKSAIHPSSSTYIPKPISLSSSMVNFRSNSITMATPKTQSALSSRRSSLGGNP